MLRRPGCVRRSDTGMLTTRRTSLSPLSVLYHLGGFGPGSGLHLLR